MLSSHWYSNNLEQEIKSNLGRAASPALKAENNYATNSPLVSMGCYTYTPKTTPSQALALWLNGPPCKWSGVEWTTPSPSTSPPSSNTPIPRLTPLTTSNGIQIQSAIFSQFTHRTNQNTERKTNRQTDSWARRQLCSNTRLCCNVLIESDNAKN